MSLFRYENRKKCTMQQALNGGYSDTSMRIKTRTVSERLKVLKTIP